MQTTDLFGRPLKSTHKSTLGKKFFYPPFSVWNAREGHWQDRKREWIRLGIRSELGRGESITWKGEDLADVDVYRHREGKKLATSYIIDGGSVRNSYTQKDVEQQRERLRAPTATPSGSPMPAMDYRNRERGDGRGRPLENSKAKIIPGGGAGAQKKSVWLNSSGNPIGGAINAKQGSEADELASGSSGTSIFDPVVCELFYRWFTPAKGVILDPFAGGSVRGIVAGVLGRNYVGIDLRPEQLKANEQQAELICDPDNQPFWLPGDSRNIVNIVQNIVPDFKCDGILSCPPYFDLEIYSDDPRDLSTVTWEAFCESYQTIISESVSLLKEDRFACFVVGDMRDKKGCYRNFTGLTIDCFENAGCRLYNEVQLVTAVGSLPLRVGRSFAKTRKMGRSHQAVLVFVKGDPVRAAEACEDIQWLTDGMTNYKINDEVES